jgi:hypothetical protein
LSTFRLGAVYFTGHPGTLLPLETQRARVAFAVE